MGCKSFAILGWEKEEWRYFKNVQNSVSFAIASKGKIHAHATKF
jgi:hypothetical protein